MENLKPPHMEEVDGVIEIPDDVLENLRGTIRFLDALIKEAEKSMPTVKECLEALKVTEGSIPNWPERDETFEGVVKPVMEWLAENQHPHMKIIIDSTNAEMVEGIMSVNSDELD